MIGSHFHNTHGGKGKSDGEASVFVRSMEESRVTENGNKNEVGGSERTQETQSQFPACHLSAAWRSCLPHSVTASPRKK